LGTLGHDFFSRPLLRYSFLMIECQIGIFARVKEKQGGQERETHQEQKRH
jgi:hypothetical protein